MRQAGKVGIRAHFFIGDGPKDDLHGFLNLLEKNGAPADRISHHAGGSAPGGFIIQSGIHRDTPPPAGRISEAALCGKLAAAARTRILIHGNKTTPGKILHAVYPQLNEAEIASLAKYSIDDLLAEAVAPLGRLQNGRLIPRMKIKTAAGKAAAWRRIVLDGEALAAGRREDIHPARELTLRRLAREGLTAEDADALRRTLTPAEINRRRVERTAGLLRGLGQGARAPRQHQGRITKGRHLENSPTTDVGIHAWPPRDHRRQPAIRRSAIHLGRGFLPEPGTPPLELVPGSSPFRKTTVGEAGLPGGDFRRRRQPGAEDRITPGGLEAAGRAKHENLRPAFPAHPGAAKNRRVGIPARAIFPHRMRSRNTRGAPVSADPAASPKHPPRASITVSIRPRSPGRTTSRSGSATPCGILLRGSISSTGWSARERNG